MVSKREKDTTGNFYEVMEEYYWKGPGDERHTSPTKRLISLKNSTAEHKKALKGNVKLSQTYSLTYCSSPGRSYVIEPHGGELNYNLAEKNLSKFFDQVFNQEITEHKVREIGGAKASNVYHKKPVEITSKVTKRPYLKIMEKIRMKLFERLRENLGGEHPDSNIILALQDRHIEQSIKKLMKEDRIRLLNEQNEPVYRDQIAHAANLEHHEEPAKEELTVTLNVTKG